MARKDSRAYGVLCKPGERRREVYFVQARRLGLIKIGQADCARSRLSSLQTSCPDRLKLLGVIICDEDGALERRLHTRFRQSRSHGEWFHPSEALLRFIAENAQEAPPRRKAREPKYPPYNEWDVVLQPNPQPTGAV